MAGFRYLVIAPMLAPLGLLAAAAPAADWYPTCSAHTVTKTETCTITASCSTSTKPSSTPTAPSQACLNVKPICNPDFAVDYYPQRFLGYGYADAGENSSYYITEHLTPLNTSTTDVVYFPELPEPSGGTVVYPNSTYPSQPYFVGYTREIDGMTVDANNFTLVYTGYFRPASTGTYQICRISDDGNDIFFGNPDAFSCTDGTASPSAKPLLTGAVDSAPSCATVDVIRGFHYPIRIVYGNAIGQSYLNVTVQAPGQQAATDDYAGQIFLPSCGLFL